MGHQTHLGPERGFRRVVRRSGLAGPRGPSAAAPTQRVWAPKRKHIPARLCAPGEALVCKQETEEQRNRRGPRPKAFCLLLCPLTSGSSHLVAGLPVHPEVGALNVRGDLTCTHAPGTPGVCQGKARQSKQPAPSTTPPCARVPPRVRPAYSYATAARGLARVRTAEVQPPHHVNKLLHRRAARSVQTTAVKKLA